MGLCVEAAVGRERRQQLVGDGEEAAVGRLGERRQGREVARGRGEDEDVGRRVWGGMRGWEGAWEEER